jgi:hypothetical protein
MHVSLTNQLVLDANFNGDTSKHIHEVYLLQP